MAETDAQQTAIARYLAASCAESGVELVVTDSDVLLAVAAMLRG